MLGGEVEEEVVVVGLCFCSPMDTAWANVSAVLGVLLDVMIIAATGT
jgi:hypothetical protein